MGVPGRGQGRLRVDGRFLARGAERVFLKGVTYGPFPGGEELEAGEELARMARHGFNAVRIYEEPGREFLDAAGACGLVVMGGAPWAWAHDFVGEPRLLAEGLVRLTSLAKRLGGHPAFGALLVANEVASDLVRWMGPVRVREALEELIEACRAEAPDLLVAYSNYPSTEYLEPRNADFTAFNIYLEERRAMGAYLARLQNIAGDRPVVVTEFGLDTLRHGEQRQAEVLDWHLTECLEAGIAGTTIFTWSDRWWTGGHKVTDWAFGLTRADRTAKPALTAMGRRLPGIRSHRDAVTVSEPPPISVVICTRNGAALLGACLEAATRLDYPNFEVLVVDDGSSDATRAVTARFSAVRYHYQEHAGLSAARNRGADLAKGRIISYTDDDCEPDRDWLFWLARTYDDPKVGAAGGPNLPPAARSLQAAVVGAAPGAPSHVLLGDLRAEHLPGCNLSVRREAFEQAGGFRAQFTSAGDDVDFCWRVAEAGWELAFAPAAIVWHRRRETLFGYLRQQAGYGRAEALLYEAHPERFEDREIRWEGCLYTGGTVSVDARGVIYHGTMGEAPYQGLEIHSMPRRGLEAGFAKAEARFLLRAAAYLQPRVRGFFRWLAGGPAPRFGRETWKVYQDEVRDTLEFSFLGPAPTARSALLDGLRSGGWTPCGETDRWELQRGPSRVQTVSLPADGQEAVVVGVRLQHPPGLGAGVIHDLEAIARESGLIRLD